MAAIMVLFLFSCASGPVSKNKTQALYGMIYDRSNRPVSNVSIYIDGKYRASSDIQGHFTIPEIKPKAQYAVSAKKTDYETVDMTIAYTDPSHVLYINMLSGDQLLTEAGEAIRDKKWHEAASLLSRARDAGANHSSTQFLRSILAWKREQYGEALSILTALTETERNAPYLYLFIADISQYHTGDTTQAKASLKKFLELRYDSDVEKRLRALEET
jgi:predicted Zn-dependent protease